jgi:phosphate transport system substrate-binding protein
MKLRFSRVLALLTVLILVLAACSPSEEGTDETEAPDATEAPDPTEAPDNGDDGDMGDGMYGLPIIDPLSVDASVDVGMAGSSTVFPLSELVLFQWIDDGGPEYSLDSIGSGGGIDRFCGETASDIANASRSITQEEIDLCASNGRTVIEVRVGTDALSLVTSPSNDFAADLTFEQIAIAFSLPKGSSWSDVDPSFPDTELQCFSPGADSGTFDFFYETIFPEMEEADEPAPMLESCEIVGEDDNITVEGVSGDSCAEGGVCAIGYFGYAFFQQNADILQVVAVDAGQGDGPIVPGDDSVNEGTYPIARPLFMYTASEVVAEKLPVAQFMAYYLSNVNDLISDVGYFPAPEDKLEEAAQNIVDAAPGLAG